MKIRFFIPFIAFFGVSVAISSCRQEDPGPRQNSERSFAMLDFDRIEVSDEFDVTVQRGSAFSIDARGDSRNLGDMVVDKSGSTLRIKYNDYRKRQYTTYVTVTMPVIRGVEFSGSVNGRVGGFTDSISRFDISLSGASVGQINVLSEEIYVSLTGASSLRLMGAGKKMQVSVSGASEFSGLEYPVDWVESVVSGASKVSVAVNQHLKINASGASEVIYRGEPQIEAEVSGTSVVTKE